MNFSTIKLFLYNVYDFLSDLSLFLVTTALLYGVITKLINLALLIDDIFDWEL